MRITCLRHVEYMEKNRNLYKILVRNPEKKRPLEDKGIDGSISKWISRHM
jgi:hypothetical protein